MPQPSGLRQYRRGTFHKKVAYGQRDRKLMLVARGIMEGFKVTCKSEKDAEDLAYSFRKRASRIESQEYARFSPKVKVNGRKLFVVGTPKHSAGSLKRRTQTINPHNAQ